MYLDTTYLAKFYLPEPDSLAVREIVRRATEPVNSSAWALAEFHCTLHRHMREGAISRDIAIDLASRFAEHHKSGLWNFVPIHDTLLRRASAFMMSLPQTVFIRTGDAIHLMTASELGEKEIWTNDRHMLAAAPHFGLTGRSVSSEPINPSEIP